MLDSTPNVGAETEYFGKNSDLKITASEIDPNVYKDLVENVKKYKNIKTINGDSTKLMDDFYDIILCDPPWGGADYK